MPGQHSCLPAIGPATAASTAPAAEAIDEPPPTFREVVKLRDIERRPNAEVADRLHLSRQHVAVRRHRAYRLLRARLLGER